MVERERPPRKRLVPRQVYLYTGIAAVVVLLVVLAMNFTTTRAAVTVPDIIGLEESVASVRLTQLGLIGEVTEELFDPSDAGTVLDQDPPPGTELPGGSVVRLTVSAGTEEFPLPDVIGVNIRVARAQLEERGLVIKIDTIESDATSDTVIMSNPSPGATVRTSDIVRLTVSGQTSASPALMPYGLENTSFAIDPSLVADDAVDAPAEVARRLRSLLEASGARILITRDANTADPSEAGRAAAITGTWTGVIGLDAPATGDPGLAVLTLETGVSQAVSSASSGIAEAVATELAQTGAQVGTGSLQADQVLLLSGSPGVRVRLGSSSVPEDAAAFRDPAWADEIARAIYRAIGEQFGTR
jgi:hypothetical protein